MSLWAFRFLLWYICILIVQPQHRFPFLMPFRIANLCMVIATGLHIGSALIEGRPVFRFGPATKLALALLGFGLISQYAGLMQTYTGWNSYIDMLVKNAYMLILIEATAITVERVWAVPTTMALATLWWIKGGLRLSQAGATWGMGDRIMGPASGLVQDPNFFAYMMGVFMPLYLYYSRSGDRKLVRWAGLAVALASFFISLRTGSRAGLLQLVALGALMLPRYWFHHRRALLIAVAAFFFLVPLSGKQNIERFKTLPESISAFLKGRDEKKVGPDAYSAMERRTKIKDTWALIQEYPLFGVGMNPDESLFRDEYWGATAQVHCEILMAGRQMGYIGMSMHVGFLLIPFLIGRSVQKRWAGSWPALSDMGYTIKIMALMFAIGGSFLPLPWHPILLALNGTASALYLNLKALEEAERAGLVPAGRLPDTAGPLTTTA